jgi:hypothetical protein
MSLLPPPEEVEYYSRKELEDGLQNHAKVNGYAITVQRSNMKDGAIYYHCDRSGVYKPRHGRNEINRIRDTGTRLTDCPFSVRANLKDGTWTIKVRNGDHNHPATPAIAHHIHRKPPPEISQQVADLTAAGSAPREILSAIRLGSDHPILASDIYNLRKDIKAKNLAGKTPMEALIDQLSHSNYISDYRTDSIGRVTHLFFAHPRSVELFQQYPDILLLDCTYKTNRFKMPLLVIIGSTCVNTSFFVGFCFLPKEQEEDYVWALEQLKMLYFPGVRTGVMLMDRELALINAVRAVFPSTIRLLCVWHVEKDIQKKASKAFEQAEDSTAFLREWTAVINSISTTAYDENWNKFQDTYDFRVPALVQYVKETWLDNFKLSLVQAYADLHLHFDNRTTSRVEGAHSILKKYLQVSTGDLKMVFEKISLLLTNQHVEYDGAVGKDQMKTPHFARNALYSQLLGRVSNFALGKIDDQRFRLIKPEPLALCTSRFTTSMGLPCAHQIQELLKEDRALTLADIHPHWYFHAAPRLEMMPLVLEPAVAQVRGRPSTQEDHTRARPLNRAARTRQALSSTRREPSAFELVDLPVRARTRSGLRSAQRQETEEDV